MKIIGHDSTNSTVSAESAEEDNQDERWLSCRANSGQETVPLQSRKPPGSITLHNQSSIIDFRVPVRLKTLKHCIHDAQNFMAHCDNCTLVPPTDHKPLILAFELTLALAGRVEISQSTWRTT